MPSTFPSAPLTSYNELAKLNILQVALLIKKCFSDNSLKILDINTNNKINNNIN